MKPDEREMMSTFGLAVELDLYADLTDQMSLVKYLHRIASEGGGERENRGNRGQSSKPVSFTSVSVTYFVTRSAPTLISFE